MSAPVYGTAPTIAINGLTRRFGSKVALDGLTLQVPRGVVFGLVGANGGGRRRSSGMSSGC